MCNCKNIENGSYGNQIMIPKPNHIKYNNSMICIDRCIADEIISLWRLGIKTTGCCCGHNNLPGYVGVENSDIPKMKALGYTVQFNACRPNDKDTFNLKTL
jgi:hypothetical protein